MRTAANPSSACRSFSPPQGTTILLWELAAGGAYLCALLQAHDCKKIVLGKAFEQTLRLPCRSGLNAISVAESALTTILMLARRAIEQQETFRQRGIGWPLGTQLDGKTLGIIGHGTIGVFSMAGLLCPGWHCTAKLNTFL